MKRIRTPLVKKRWGMYAEQFALLQKGDVIKGRGGDLRIIEKTSPTHTQNNGETYFIYLLKLHPSWTKSEYTCYTIGDSFLFRPVKVKNKRIWELDRERVIQERAKKYKTYKKKKIAVLQKQIKKLESIP